ncbi:hypothetical protein JMN32_07990 [Fulvivirga sp. 29W222]|uniref:RND transporter n=1 Tax=Fulvivirga marina TaxID=2494733 RepID=A0A937FUN8_9BACT|nr:hypothetical protein [Fulvivirga marina]MBL6446244.1 hypothetical protein [Fulvivirga marina]
MKNNKEIILALVLALTLGLAPFFPEPHILGKLRWVLGGAKGMQFMDYFDLALHGFPWVMLVGAVIKRIRG